MRERENRPGEYSEAASSRNHTSGHHTAGSKYAAPCPDCGEVDGRHTDWCMFDGSGPEWHDPDPESSPHPTRDLSVQEFRKRVRDHVARNPGVRLPELMEVFDAKRGRVSAALREPRYFRDPDSELPPVPGWFTDRKTKRRYLGWSYPSSPQRYVKFLRSHLQNTFGDIYNLERLMNRVEQHFGSEAVPHEARRAIEELMIAADIHAYWLGEVTDDE